MVEPVVGRLYRISRFVERRERRRIRMVRTILVFMGFAPYQKPKVAIAVFVENAGFGATYAVPIGKLMLEKYLKGEISEANKATEEYIMNAVILPNNAL